MTNASELAQGIVQLLPALDVEERRQLKRLLSHELAAPSAAVLRRARLGLLVELVAEGHDLSVADYDVERAKRREREEEWPTGATIAKAYGHWQTAKSCALRYWEQGGAARVPADMHHAQGTRAPYTERDVVDAIRLVRRSLGAWPTEWEYHEAAKLARRMARLSGSPEPKYPTAKVIRTLLGDYDTALAAARKADNR